MVTATCLFRALQAGGIIDAVLPPDAQPQSHSSAANAAFSVAWGIDGSTHFANPTPVAVKEIAEPTWSDGPGGITPPNSRGAVSAVGIIASCTG